MLDLPASMTFEEHLIELCDRVGIAKRSGAAALPSSAAHLDKARRFWNAGYRTFLTSDPKWTFLKRDHTLTLDPSGEGVDNVDSDPARYRLPSYCVGIPSTNWTFTDVMATCPFAQVTDRQAVEQIIQQGQTTLAGTPRYAGHYTIEAGDGIENEPTENVVVFYPTPDQAYVARATFRVTRHQLRDLGERHVAGADHDQTILACAMVEWANTDEAMASRLTAWIQSRDEKLQASKALDLERRPRQLGTLPIAGVNDPAMPTRRRTVLDHGVQMAP